MSHLDKIANWATIVACCIVAVVAIHAARQHGTALPPLPSFEPGDDLTGVTEVDFSRSQRTLLMAISSSCSYCTASMPFYRSLLSAAGGRPDRLRFVALTSTTDTRITNYVSENALTLDEMVSIDPLKSTVHFPPTPTLILVDSTGHVVKAWMGQLGPESEQEVRTMLS